MVQLGLPLIAKGKILILTYKDNRKFKNFTNTNFKKDINFSKDTYLNLLVLRCKDIEKSKEFYEKLKLIFIKEQHGKGPIHYSTSMGNLVIELYPSTQNIIDNTRLGFSINTDDLENYLKDKQIDIDTTYAFNNTIIFVVKDPDGRKVELTANQTK